MRVLHLTDTHLGAVMHVHGAPRGWSRALDHAEAMRLALAPALREEVDLVVHTGDLFDRSAPDGEALRAAARLLGEAARRVPVVVIPGNHDRQGLSRSLPVGLPGLHVADRPGALRLRGLALGLVPWVREAEAWAAAAREACAGGVDLLLAHQSFDGARVPGYTFRARARADTPGREHLPPGLRWVLCGHIHMRQRTRPGEVEVVQPGATERASFGELGQTKGFALWELEREVRWRFVDLPSRPMALVDDEAGLDGLAPGTLVKGGLPPERVVQAGGWPLRAARDAPLPPLRSVEEQLSLFGR